MAAIRRTLSPVPRPGGLPNGEPCLVASPLSRSTSCTQNYQPPVAVSSPSFSSFDYALYKVQGFIVDLFSKRSSRPLERPKPMGQARRRSLLHFSICFMIGFFYGLTPFASMNPHMNVISKYQAFSFKVVQTLDKDQSSNIMPRNVTTLLESSDGKGIANLISNDTELVRNGTSIDTLVKQSLNEDLNMSLPKLLIVVTATCARPFQAHYLNRLARTLKLIPPPLLWIVVDVGAQSAETAEILRENGVMYRHLVCNINLSDIKDRNLHQRNVALSHIETHRLDGIVYFADDDCIYSAEIFEQMREIRRFGTWMVAKLMESSTRVILEGPICNGTEVIGWHTNGATGQFQRFHAEMSGFAFNSTILWDQKRWHRPTLEPIRQHDTVRTGIQASAFIEQIVEDESQMECFPLDCSKIMVWNLPVGPTYSYPPEWLIKNKNLGVTVPLA